MKKWGLVVTLFYGVLVLTFLMPVMMFIASNTFPGAAEFKQVYTSWGPWICAVAVMLGEALLLWLSADTTQRRLKPRTHILVSALTAGLLLAILTFAGVLAFGLGVWGEKFIPDFHGLAPVLSAVAIPWLIWGILFYRLWRNSSDPATCAVAWLLRGSVLELLIAVPAHVMVRRRHECCAPVITGFGISAGLAIMLMSFGPSVLLLYKKRMERYSIKALEGK